MAIDNRYEENAKNKSAYLESGWYRFWSVKHGMITIGVDGKLTYFEVATDASILLGCAMQDLQHTYLGKEIQK